MSRISLPVDLHYDLAGEFVDTENEITIPKLLGHSHLNQDILHKKTFFYIIDGPREKKVAENL